MALIVLAVFCCMLTCAVGTSEYYGVYVGRLPTYAHMVTGDVYVVDEKHIWVRGFVYDGTAPAAYWWVGKRGTASPTPDQATGMRSSDRIVRSYSNENVLVTLPDSLTVRDIRWLSAWCEAFTMDFGHVNFSVNVQVPSPQVIGQFSDETNAVSSGDITAVDIKTLNVTAFTCQCAQKGVRFIGGNESLIIILEEHRHSSEELDNANRLNIYLRVPGEIAVRDLQFIGVHSFTNNVTLACVDITLPSSTLIPPFIENDGLYEMPPRVSTQQQSLAFARTDVFNCNTTAAPVSDSGVTGTTTTLVTSDGSPHTNRNAPTPSTSAGHSSSHNHLNAAAAALALLATAACSR